MKKGFSLHISPHKTQIKSHLSGDYDDFYFNDHEVEIILEGLILNKNNLINSFAISKNENFILELFRQKKEKFVDELDGEFRGCVFDKVRQKTFVFTNTTSTQRVFYTKIKDEVYVDTSLIRLSKTLKTHFQQVQPHLEGIYQILCFGGLLEEHTLIDGVKKILDGHVLEIDNNTTKLNTTAYFNWQNTSENNFRKQDALDETHEIFLMCVKQEYEKDLELGSPHFALLSGGMDSRVSLFYAMKNGFKPDLAFCFSQSDYFDEIISKKIAKDYDIPYEFVPLDGGSFLKKIELLTQISEGLVTYTGGIHVNHALENLQFQNFKIFHGGHIGDVVLGGFNTKKHDVNPKIDKLVYNKDFLPNVKNSVEETLKKYEKEEHLLLRNSAFNRTLFGLHVLQQKAYQTSPFITKPFINLALQLPAEWKHKQKFYIEWVNKHCKEATNYVWERTLLKPNATWKTNLGDVVVKRAHRIWFDKILQQPQKTTMYPYQYYFDRHVDIQEKYKQYFDENIYLLNDFTELQKSAVGLFSSNNFFSKVQAIHLLSIFKMYFSE